MSGPPDILDVLVIGARQAGPAPGHHLTTTGARCLIVDAAFIAAQIDSSRTARSGAAVR